jgi:mRNA degradation ribonuclease J1/J2
MPSLTFYGGVREIGGNQILLQHKDTKIFLDFGKNFGRRTITSTFPFCSPSTYRTYSRSEPSPV